MTDQTPIEFICSGCSATKSSEAEANACAIADMQKRIEEEARRRKP